MLQYLRLIAKNSSTEVSILIYLPPSWLVVSLVRGLAVDVASVIQVRKGSLLHLFYHFNVWCCI